MKIVLWVGMLILSFHVASAVLYVDDPNDCPQTDSQFPGQSCAPNVICGVSGSIPQCFDPSSISAPASSSTTITQVSASLGGGYIIDCFATADSSAPFCDNEGSAHCNRDSSCLNKDRLTLCTANLFGDFSCGECRSGYVYCSAIDSPASPIPGDNSCFQVDAEPGSSIGGGSNTVVDDTSCNLRCSGSFRSCDAIDTLGDPEDGDGCETAVGSGSSPAQTNIGVTDNNNFVTTSCGVSCESGFLSCDGISSVGSASDADGCEVNQDVTSGTTLNASATNTVIGAGCNLECASTYIAPDGDIGNGCEAQVGDACTTGGGAPGTYSGSGTSVTCDPAPPVDVFANIFNESYGDAYIFGKQLNPQGNLINLTGPNNDSFVVNSSGCILFPDGTVQCSGANVSITLTGNLSNITNITSDQIQDDTITDADISDTTNLTLGEKITFGFGEFIDNIIDGWIRITGGLNVTGDVDVQGDLTVGGEKIENIWTNNSREVYLRATFPQNLNVSGNLTVGSKSFSELGGDLIITY